MGHDHNHSHSHSANKKTLAISLIIITAYYGSRGYWRIDYK